MAIDYYAAFKNFDNRGGKYLSSESTSIFSLDEGVCAAPFKTAATGDAAGKNGIFEIQDFNLDIEQQLNIGSQSTGTGSGRVKFNNFSITRQIDKSSPDMFLNMCVGTPFDRVYIGLRKSGGLSGSGNTPSGLFYVLFEFAVVAVAKITWAHDDERPKETIEFGYGAVQISYAPQKSDGSLDAVKHGAYSVVTSQNVMPAAGWNGAA